MTPQGESRPKFRLQVSATIFEDRRRPAVISAMAATASFEVNYIILAWLIAAVMKIAQGSGTVSMITTSSIMVAIIGDGSALGYHPIYVLMAIGFGAMFITWMNDSGYWVVCKMGGLTEGETLKSWTMCLIVMGLAGLPIVWLVSVLFPMAG